MTDERIYCACGCGQEVRKAKYPSQQPRFINTHQHKKDNNGNWRGGKIKSACPVCGDTFYTYTHKNRRVTCGKDMCYRTWQGLTTAARGSSKVITKCNYCGRELRLFPSQVKERNYCNRFCLAKDNPKNGNNNGNWRGGRWRYIQEQVFIRDEYRCAICGFDLAVDAHHITARTKGGTNDFSNLITLCPNHHRLADLGIISVEHLRNYTWQPEHTVDTSILPSANH